MSVEEILAEDDPTGELSRPKGGGVQPLPSSSYVRPPETDVIERAKRYVAKMPPAIQGQNGSAATYAVATVLVHGYELSPDVALSLMASEYNPRCEPAWSDAELRHKIDDALRKGHHQPKGWLLADDRGGGMNVSPSPRPSPPPAPVGQGSPDSLPVGPGDIDDPYRLACGFVDQPAWTHLRDYLGEFVQWDGGAYRTLADSQVVNPLSNWTESMFRLADTITRKNTEEGKEPPRKKQVTRYLVNNTLGAIRGLRSVNTHGSPPMWIDGVTGPNPAQIIPLRNGLYDLKADALLPHSPAFLSFSVAPFDYDREAPRPTKWLKFLAEVWPDDPDSIACLQEWFGYLLTPDTSMQKILFLLGPPRAGKGTIARVLEAIVGPQNVTGPMLSTLAMDYAVAGLVGKSLALIGDARLSGRTDSAHVAGVLNTISGEDKLTIPRKYKDDLQVRLTTRFVILSNELPRILDSSGALSKRVVMLQFTQSFVGRENRFLSDQITSSELPGILLWAIEGWRRLRDKGQFTQPQSARDSIEEMEDLGSPVGSFLRERCVIQEGASVPVKDMYSEWRSWCEAEGRRDPGTLAVFGRDLKAVASMVKRKRIRLGGETPWVYVGVRMKAYDDEQSAVDAVPGVPSVPSNSFIVHVAQDQKPNEVEGAEYTIKELLGTLGTPGTQSGHHVDMEDL